MVILTIMVMTLMKLDKHKEQIKNNLVHYKVYRSHLRVKITIIK
jgi:hypothetical protein